MNDAIREEALRLLSAEDERQSKLHELLETIREQIRLKIPAEHRPDGLFKNIQDAVYTMRGRTLLMNDAAITAALAAPQADAEPVAYRWRGQHSHGPYNYSETEPPYHADYPTEPLYTTPPSQAADRMRTMIDRYTVDIVKNAMLTMWNDICADTDCHPLDIEHGRGKYLTFTPKHWAEACGKMVRRNVLDLIGAEDGKKSEGGIQGAPEIPGVRGPRTFVRQLVDDPNSSSGKSLRDVEVHPSDPTPPDREAIARIVREAMYEEPYHLTSSKGRSDRRCEIANAAAEAILALRGGE